MKEDLPQHIAIIMEGNRRWAREHGLEAKQGHKEGAKTLEKIVRYAKKIGIKYFNRKLEKNRRRGWSFNEASSKLFR